MIRLHPDNAEALWEADLARIALRREFEGWPIEAELNQLREAS